MSGALSLMQHQACMLCKFNTPTPFSVYSPCRRCPPASTLVIVLDTRMLPAPSPPSSASSSSKLASDNEVFLRPAHADPVYLGLAVRHRQAPVPAGLALLSKVVVLRISPDSVLRRSTLVRRCPRLQVLHRASPRSSRMTRASTPPCFFRRE
jgi:hypothetical protein